METLFTTISYYIPVGETEKEIIADLWKERSFAKGELFLQEGKICRQVGFIEKGLVRYYINQDGEERTFSFGRENEFVSNYESLVPQAPSTKGIEALEDTVMYVMSYDNLQRMYAILANADRLVRLLMEQLFVQTLQELNSFYVDTPEQRYSRLLQTHPDLLQRIPQYYIASWVGVKPQSLSRIRKRIAGS